MKRKTTHMVTGIVLIALFAIPVLLVSDGIDAENPSGLSLTIYQTDLMTDASGAPVTVFTSETGSTIDIVANPGDAFGQGDVPAGTYKRLKFTVKNRVLYSGLNPCGGAPIVDQPLDIDSTQGPDAQVELYFATSEDGGNSGWYSNGTGASPFLMQNAVLVEGGTTTTLTLIFNTSNTLQCIGGAAELLPPTMNAINYVEETEACSIAGNYWFAHFNVSTIPVYENGAIVLNPTYDQLLKNTWVDAGWGTLTFNADGTWQVDQTKSAENGGMAEHFHGLTSYFVGSGEGYFNPAGSEVLTGNYTLAGSHIIMYFPWGGYMEGGFTDDCHTFVGANIANTENSDLVYGVKKRTTQPQFTGKKYAAVSPSFNIAYDDLNNNRANFFNFEGDLMIIDWIDAANVRSLEWGTSNEFSVNYDINTSEITGMLSWGSREEAYQESKPMTFTFSNDGLVNTGVPNSDSFIAVGASGSAIVGGGIPSTAPNDDVILGPNEAHRVSAGLFMETDPSPVLSDFAGTWTLSLYNAELRDQDGTWGNGNETAVFGLSYAAVVFDSSGSGTYAATDKDALSGSITSNTGNVVIEGPFTECYELNTPVADTTCATGATMPVFHMKESGTVVAKLILESSKKVITMWSPFDTNDMPESEDCGYSAATAPTACTQATNYILLGAGVKTQ